MMIDVISIMWKNREDRVLVPSSADLLYDKDTFILIVQDKGTGDKIGHIPTQSTTLWNWVKLLVYRAILTVQFVFI